METEPFSIAIEEGVLSDLRDRIRATRWPPPSPEAPWQQGADLGYLRELLADWAAFDWRAQEERLNAVEHFRADVDGVRIHYVHVPGGGTPLILTHGWPSTFVEHLQLVPYLRERFDLVIPSLPGYGLSERPARNTTRDTARFWHRLMQGLGYTRYGAQGGDFGASVTTHMALEDPEPLIGIHLHQIDDRPPSTDSPTAAEREYLAAVEAWDAVERGYSSIQSTKPQTVAYGLNDSPAGLAAWIVEKWRSWSDDLAAIDRDVLLTNLTLFWATQTIATSMRDYYDMRWHRPAIEGPVRVPTGVALFANELVSEGTPPREWGERLYGDLRRWTPMPRGGHFAPAEQPELLARDITEFFDDL